MLRAVQPRIREDIIRVPADLDNTDDLQALRQAIEESILAGTDSVELDCSALTTISPPVIGWLFESARQLHETGRSLSLHNVAPAIYLKYRNLHQTLPEIKILPRQAS